ncbi:MAG: group III truncated hemoglobin [Alphaproteobacteria bacterium]|nr:group III truncated hemoglobin [Alphaproteobacteria bacterium]
MHIKELPMPAGRAELAAAIVARTGIDEAMIERLVRSFYARVAEDDLLGPVFATRIADWEPHLLRMCDFWSSVALMSGRYHGQPFPMHMKLPIEQRHFDRWIQIFIASASEQCPPAAAAHFIERARRIADSMALGLATLRSPTPPPIRTPAPATTGDPP